MVYSEDSLCQSTLEQHHDQLLTKCYLLACDAVALDRQGSVDAATEGYRKVIKMCHELLDMEQTHRDELEQKLDKYVHRLDQLSRLQQASVYTKKTLSDAQENIKADAATNNNNNKSEESEEESEEEWEADIRFSLAKAQFAMDQAEVNEKKGFTEEALDYYSDAAELFLSSYRGTCVMNIL
ncbi:hypothetical protein BDF14DRAFT_700359 [Spinellus fusiger]|nr:hypothetical protein BDF14DRAFT_700359 [Spinellus fusiger]